MNCFIEIKICIDGDVYRYSGNDINRTIKNAKRMYMSKLVSGYQKTEQRCEKSDIIQKLTTD